MEKSLIVLTDSFPYGTKETFLESEIHFLSNGFNTIHIFPLHGSGKTRPQVKNVHVHPPFLPFNPKEQKKTLWYGLLNLSPIRFIIKDLLAHAVYKNSGQLRVWLAAMLVFRAAYANRRTLSELTTLVQAKGVVYSYWGDKLSTMIPFLKKENPQLTSVVRFHRTDIYEEFKYGHIPFRQFVFPHIDHFVFISEDGKHYLQNRYPQWVIQSHLYRLGVSDQGVNPINKETFHLVSCSYMVAVKRISLIIEALKQLEYPIHWTHIGSGPQWEEITRLAMLLPPNIEVTLLGECTNKEVISFYQRTPIDLFINVSESEGVPVSIMEALSFGIPVIATNAGGTGEIVDEKVGCLLPVSANAYEISSAINNVYRQTSKEELRQNARKRWMERCDASNNYASFVNFLQRISD